MTNQLTALKERAARLSDAISFSQDGDCIRDGERRLAIIRARISELENEQ